jgi:hypothetical protein
VVPRELSINSLKIQVLDYRILILDELGDVSEAESKAIVKYLFSEGFIDNPNIRCEIIRSGE